jgi:hypothetical protein
MCQHNHYTKQPFMASKLTTPGTIGAMMYYKAHSHVTSTCQLINPKGAQTMLLSFGPQVKFLFIHFFLTNHVLSLAFLSHDDDCHHC